MSDRDEDILRSRNFELKEWTDKNEQRLELPEILFRAKKLVANIPSVKMMRF